MSNKRLNGIQFLRGFAVLAVVLGHNRGTMYDNIVAGSFIDYITSNAIFGVEVFFVISGFIISHSTQSIKFSSFAESLSFLIKRFFRIYPLYLMVLALYVSLYYYNYYTGEFSLGHLSIENIIQSVFISSYQSDVISPIYGWGALVVAWTLRYEIYFYIIFAISMIFTAKYRSVLTTAIIITIFIFSSYYYQGHLVLDAQSFPIPNTTPDKYIGFAGNPIVLDFILGMIIAESEKLFGNNRFYNNKNTGYFYIVIINICFILWFTSAFGGNGITRSGIIAFFLVFSVVRIERIFSPSFPKIITIIGESSYSLYLIHIPVKEFADYYGNYFSFIPKQGTLALFIASISLSITLPVLIFNLIEKPINRFGHRLANKILPTRN